MAEKPLIFTKEQEANFKKWWAQYSRKIEVSEVAGPIQFAPPHEEDTPRFRPALWPVKEEDRDKNLQKYVKLALNMGAADAALSALGYQPGPAGTVRDLPQSRLPVAEHQ